MFTCPITGIDNRNGRIIRRQFADPISGWRKTIASEYCSKVRTVSARVSPLLTELNCTPCVIGITAPPKRSIAAIKEELVRVLGS